jgi:uncharacterized protein (DUF779 family)
VLLGHVAGVPFYIDAEQYERWGEPEFLLDVVSDEARRRTIAVALPGGERVTPAA